MKHFNNVPHNTELRGMLTIVVAAAVLAAAVSSRVHAQCQYEVTAIITGPDCPFIGQAALIPTAMNEAGDVAGYWLECDVTANHAFYWSAKTGVLTTLPRPPEVSSAVATGLNDNGLIVGTHSIIGVGDRAFVYDLNNPDAGFTYMQPKHGVGGSWANALNNNSIIAGARSISKSGNNPHNAVIWRPFEKRSPVEDLGVMEGPNSEARDINALGLTAGWTGQSSTAIAYRQNPRFIDFIMRFMDFDISFSNAIAATGEVVGAGIPANKQNSIAFVWQDDSVLIIPPIPPYTKAGAVDINAVGQVLVGMNPGDVTGLWQYGELHLINPTARAIALNDSGQILIRVATRAHVLAPQNVPLGDLNYDCKVDAQDLQILLDQWGPAPRGDRNGRETNGAPTADLNGDGVVDGHDLLILLANWSP